jgi:hypothetical protein
MKTYEPPFARDISERFVRGQESPQGVCKSGSLPFYQCVNGPGVLPICDVGGTPDTSACSPGGYHSTPACRTGGVAATICLSGSGQQ